MIKYKYTGNGFQGRPAPEYPTDFLRGLFRSMLRIRMIEEAIESRYDEDQMKTPIHLVIGQEASVVGSCAAFRKEDLVTSGHRTHGVYLAKGGDLKAMMSELFCRANGCAGSRGGSMHLFDQEAGMPASSAICGGAVPITAGIALSMQYRREGRLAAVFFGDGASEEGAVWESVNFALLKKLPVLFMCENNFYSVCSPLDKRQATVDIFKKAEGFGMHSILVDANDVLAVYDATNAAAARAKNGEGPTFLELRGYRWRAHGGAGDDSKSGYRDVEELKAWQEFCPIEGYFSYLKQHGKIDDTYREQVTGEIRREIEEAFKHAMESPNPTEADLYTHVYAP